MIKEIVPILLIFLVLVYLRKRIKPKKKVNQYVIFKSQDCNNSSCGVCWFAQDMNNGVKTSCFRSKEELKRYLDGQ